jgi:thioredoxin-dependent peroxiredoxin
MPVELRKRPPPKETAAPAPAAKRGSSSKVKQLADKAKKAVLGDGAKDENTVAAPEQPTTTGTSAPVISETVPQAPSGAANGSTKSGKLTVGDKLNLDGFGGTVQTHDGTDVTVRDLLEKSGSGLVIFTYPKASTPGCKYSILLDHGEFTLLIYLQVQPKHVSSVTTMLLSPVPLSPSMA